MTLTLELTADQEERLKAKARQHGQDITTYLLTLAEADDAPSGDPASEEGSAADLFAGRLGRIHSGGQGRWSEDTGAKFTDGLREKQRRGHL